MERKRYLPGTYDKLVRHRIPDIIRREGLVPVTHAAGFNEHYRRLRDKLIEEANEAFEAQTRREMTEELADVMQVVDDIAKIARIDRREIEAVRQTKESTRGNFSAGIVLDRVEEVKTGRARS